MTAPHNDSNVCGDTTREDGGISIPCAEIIARLEKAEGPDRELDSLIARSLETRPTIPFATEAPFERLEGMYWVIGSKDTAAGAVEEKWSKNPPLYTFSIDAALTLVPKGWTVARINENDDKTWAVELREGFLTSYGRVVFGGYKHNDPTPALALCIAALRALGS